MKKVVPPAPLREDQMTAARADLVPDAPRSQPSPAGHSLPSEPVADAERATVTDLTARIADRQIIDEAKRLLMTRGNLTEPEAHRWIQKTAMDRRTSKQTIALGITEALSEKT
jgi:hypothetical protein